MFQKESTILQRVVLTEKSPFKVKRNSGLMEDVLIVKNCVNLEELSEYRNYNNKTLTLGMYYIVTEGQYTGYDLPKKFYDKLKNA